MIQTVSQLTFELSKLFGTEQFIVHSTLAIVLTSLICGGVGSMVVGNRMAFFSDALAHCAIAGMTLGLIIFPQVSGGNSQSVISLNALLVCVGFGAMVGVGIAYVREKTGLASDTVIGVFFAGALGLGAILFGFLKQVSNVDPEVILFGSPTFVAPADLIRLVVLFVLTVAIVGWRYNQLVFASFNASLARSRGIPLRLYNYSFILLLALIVNVCLVTVGALLINAMLIVPAATANNVSRNMRQMFWWTIGLSLFAGLGGQWASLWIAAIFSHNRASQVGTGGCVIILSVVCFAVSMALGRWFKGRQSR